MNTQHTPGPWIKDDRHIHPTNGRLAYPKGVEPETDVIVLVDTDQHPNGILNETDQANLRLIAAAPELLEACKYVTELIKTARRYFPKSTQNRDTFSLENACAAIGKAIYKAEGKQ